ADVAAYFAHNFKSPLPQIKLFGTHLFWVFDPHDEAQFEYRGEMNADNNTMVVFGFRVTKSPKHLPAIGWVLPGSDGQYVGIQGLLWIDKSTSSLRRIVVHETDFEPRFEISAWSSAIDYSWVQIGDLGKFLLPLEAESIRCGQTGNCRRDLVKFSN